MDKKKEKIIVNSFSDYELLDKMRAKKNIADCCFKAMGVTRGSFVAVVRLKKDSGAVDLLGFGSVVDFDASFEKEEIEVTTYSDMGRRYAPGQKSCEMSLHLEGTQGCYYYLKWNAVDSDLKNLPKVLYELNIISFTVENDPWKLPIADSDRKRRKKAIGYYLVRLEEGWDEDIDKCEDRIQALRRTQVILNATECVASEMAEERNIRKLPKLWSSISELRKKKEKIMEQIHVSRNRK